MRAVISVVGKNDVGILADVSGVCASVSADIQEVTQTILQDMFTMFMLVEVIEGKTELKKLQEENVNVLILKERSPSCGYKKIYDGTFSKTIIDGNGVFASLALKNGFTIYTESDIENIIKKNG